MTGTRAGLRRIVLIGSGGSGKSTLARRLGGILGLEVIHLDALYWRPGWMETPRQEWRRVQESLVARDAWILDGNYGGTLDLRLAAADTVVLLDLPRWTCLRRTLLRTLRSRRQGRPDMAPGCPERLNAEYVKFLGWIWTYPTRRLPGLLRRLEELPPGKRVFRLRTDREAEALVRQIAAEARRPG